MLRNVWTTCLDSIVNSNFLRIILSKSDHLWPPEINCRIKKTIRNSLGYNCYRGGATVWESLLTEPQRDIKHYYSNKPILQKATSSRSTKLVHGGVRYMAQGDLLLVMELCMREVLLLKNAPHLTSNQELLYQYIPSGCSYLILWGLNSMIFLPVVEYWGSQYFIKPNNDRLRRFYII